MVAEEKTIIGDPAVIATHWEYRCHGCEQLRYYPSTDTPKLCGACGCPTLTIGRPGTLPDKKEEKDMAELHLEQRPQTFKQMVGQDAACKQLVSMVKGQGLPHTLLFTGPSGCGKTTLARIVAKKLKCSGPDLEEINAADNRGIDMVRSVQMRCRAAPLYGEVRVFVIDECHQLTPDAQGALLKILEEAPGHVYFMLATTDPQKLRKAVKTRCTEIKVRALTEGELVDHVKAVASEYDATVSDKVAAKIALVSEGSARKSMVYLQQVMGLATEEVQLKVLEETDATQAAFEIARALMAGKPWATVAGILKNVDDDPESIRWMVLSYFTTVALGGSGKAGRAVDIIDEFTEPYFNTKKAGLVSSCYRSCHGN